MKKFSYKKLNKICNYTVEEKNKFFEHIINYSNANLINDSVDYLINNDFSYLKQIKYNFTKPKTICICTGWAGGNGNARICVDLCNKLVKLSYKVIFVVDNRFTKSSYYLDEKICKISFDKVQNRNIELINLFKKEKVDLVIFNRLETKELINDLTICRLLKIRSLIYMHFCFSYFYVRKDYDVFDNLIKCISICNGIIVTNKFDFDLYKNFSPKIYLIKHSIDYLTKNDCTANLKNNVSNNIIYMARGTDQIKRIDDLLNICFELRKKTYDFKIIVCGFVDREFGEKVKRIGLNDNIEIIGYKKSIKEYLANSIAFLSTSVTESFGMSIVEAMFYNKAIVMYDIPYLPFIDAKGIFKTAIGDYETISLLIYKLLSNKEIAYEAGLNNKKYIENFYANYDTDLIWDNIINDQKLTDKVGNLDYLFNASSGVILYKKPKQPENYDFKNELKKFILFLPHTLKRILNKIIKIFKKKT